MFFSNWQHQNCIYGIKENILHLCNADSLVNIKFLYLRSIACSCWHQSIFKTQNKLFLANSVESMANVRQSLCLCGQHFGQRAHMTTMPFNQLAN